MSTIDVNICLHERIDMNNIKKYRLLAKLTQQDISTHIKCVPMNISYFENDRHKCSLDDARKIIDLFNSKGLKNEKGEKLTLDDVFPPQK